MQIRATIRRRQHNRENPLFLITSDTAYGHTYFGPEKHNTNGRELTPTAWGTTLGNPQCGHLELLRTNPMIKSANDYIVFSKDYGVMKRCIQEVSAPQQKRGATFEKQK